jgi:hypothetical protein
VNLDISRGAELAAYHADGIAFFRGGFSCGNAGSLNVVPAAGSWTEFEVHDTDGSVRIIARKGDLKLIDASGTATLSEGQETTRDETNEKGKKKDRGAGGAVPGAAGGVLDSPWAIGIGLGAAGGITAWSLLHDDEPVSPKHP